ncbi:MAG: hypothetical protein KC457_26000, partial [Myxococcales bacterium]|nr:hypothetical protein [Myxococcales bacterium]
METSQIVVIGISFAGMLGFAGVAGWIWLRMRSQTRPQTRRQSRPADASRTPAEQASVAPALGTDRTVLAPVAPAAESTTVISPVTPPAERTVVVSPVAPPAERTTVVSPVAPPAEHTAV